MGDRLPSYSLAIASRKETGFLPNLPTPTKRYPRNPVSQTNTIASNLTLLAIALRKKPGFFPIGGHQRKDTQETGFLGSWQGGCATLDGRKRFQR